MDLYQRLKEIRETQKTGAIPEPAKERRLPRIVPTGSWAAKAPGVWYRSRRVALPDRYTRRMGPFSGSIRISPLFRRGAQIDPLFFDLETTGLSSGAGNVAFLSGFGCLSDDGDDRVSVTVDQFFLLDYGFEGEYIAVIDEYLQGWCSRSDTTLVSYNGASFDVPLLTGRFIMNGRRPFSCRHLDLLPLSRLLHRNLLDDCRLGTVERDVLRLNRHNDLPGSLAPYRYREYLRSGDISLMGDVFDHHSYDVGYLAALFVHINMLFLGDLDVGEERVDTAALVKLLYERGGEGERKRAVKLMDRAVCGRLNRSESEKERLLRYRAYIEKRSGNHREAFRLFNTLWRQGNSYRDGVEAAIIAEHRLTRPRLALALCRNIAGRLKEYPEEQLEHRLQRLVRKCGE